MQNQDQRSTQSIFFIASLYSHAIGSAEDAANSCRTATRILSSQIVPFSEFSVPVSATFGAFIEEATLLKSQN